MLQKAIPLLLWVALVPATVAVFQHSHGASPGPQPGDGYAREIAAFDDLLSESSGLASHGEFLWTLNDSGSEPLLHKLDRSGRLLQSTTLAGAENIDWESMAQDETHLFIADTGNNLNSRNRFTIYRVPWESLESGSPTFETIIFRYGDYESGNFLLHNFDAEALAVRGDELWLFSKNRGDGRSRLYRFPKRPGDYAPMPSQYLETDSLITAADIHPGTGELLLVGYRLSENDYLWRIPTSDQGVDWNNRQLIVFGPRDQWEAVLWDTESDRILLTHENNTRGFAGLAELLP